MGFRKLIRNLRKREDAKNSPEIVVTRREFIRLMMNDGASWEDAVSQASSTEFLGGRFYIKGKWVSIREAKP